MSKCNEELMNKLKDLQLKLNTKNFIKEDKISDDNEVEFYKNKCKILEENLKEKTMKFTKELSQYKTKYLESSTKELLQLNDTDYNNKNTYDGYSTVKL